MQQYHKVKSPKPLIDFSSDQLRFLKKTINKINAFSQIDHKCNSFKQQSKYNNLFNSAQELNKNKLIEIMKKSKIHSQKQSQGQNSILEDQNRRNKIYDTESWKQQGDQITQTNEQKNDEIFQMNFLNKPKFKQSFSTAASFSKIKNISKQTQFNDLNINEFSLGKKLGSGKFGQVFIAKHIQSGFLTGIKRIDKSNIDNKLIIQLIRQIKIQSYLNHPNIVKLYTFFSDEKYIYLVMQLCYSGQLYNLLKKKRKLPQDLTKIIVKDTLKALDYMHERQIIHRDLKPQNIIFHSGMIKLCDFGWSISSKTMRQTFCGTPLYISPQLLKRKNYNNKIDVWSIGILTYQLLFGRVPFDITTERDFIKIVEDEIKFSRATKTSDDAKQFICICLKKDPRDRYTVAQLLEHPFITNIQPLQVLEML